MVDSNCGNSALGLADTGIQRFHSTIDHAPAGIALDHADKCSLSAHAFLESFSAVASPVIVVSNVKPSILELPKFAERIISTRRWNI